MDLYVAKAYSFKHNVYLRFLVGEATELAARQLVDAELTGDYVLDYIYIVQEVRLHAACMPFIREI